MGVHLAFIVFLFGPWQSPSTLTSGSPFLLSGFGLGSWELASLAVALVSLVVEHGYTLYKEFWVGGGYRRTIPAAQMFAPYPRIVVMHLAILGGGFLFVLFGLPRLMVVLLVVLKVGLEVGTLARSIAVR